MAADDVIALTRALLAFDTSEGGEEDPALFVGQLLAEDGFTVGYDRFAPGRLTVVAEKGLSDSAPPLVLTGHLDTVPLGSQPWTVDPFAGEIREGRLYGRGASDMKGGVAAMLVAARRAFGTAAPCGGLRLIFTAAEEPGCLGARHLADARYGLGRARAIVVGEPTSNVPYLGHKGGLYLNVTATGRAAHSSMPELGDNAIYKAARAIIRLSEFRFNVPPDPLHGLPTLNVGRMSGGKNLNSVPDHAAFTVDVRTTSAAGQTALLDRLARELGVDVSTETLMDLKPVSTAADDPFARLVYAACGADAADAARQHSLAYVTDGAVLQQLYGGVPTLILGPGEPGQAHRTDEYCQIDKLEEAARLYEAILQTPPTP